jgi:long-chain acyl-CoA synthetase
LYVVGRLKEMIIVSGYKVYPAEVEDALLEHPAVRDVAVFGVPNASTGEVVHARVVLREHCQVEVESLRSFCAERLAKFKIPKHIGFDRELPKSASGKVLRRVLRDEAMGAAPAV